ncbi:hypothetical protein SmJEL517_g04041 [Synchytrium microbalum]|uniref:C2 domain-containing protein n=1 Tax=Synchytrium microbalum TaxID=1806994 RepID=A0A507C0S1_9FUNG|nr:uncharacterized protein SmJEL517_g04041 [Synchytrium microbalum]TPX33011.1 hypothetical protein SmJEL517_g04041 [Synchytrium microbalum]
MDYDHDEQRNSRGSGPRIIQRNADGFFAPPGASTPDQSQSGRSSNSGGSVGGGGRQRSLSTGRSDGSGGIKVGQAEMSYISASTSSAQAVTRSSSRTGSYSDVGSNVSSIERRQPSAPPMPRIPEQVDRKTSSNMSLDERLALRQREREEREGSGPRNITPVEYRQQVGGMAGVPPPASASGGYRAAVRKESDENMNGSASGGTPPRPYSRNRGRTPEPGQWQADPDPPPMPTQNLEPVDEKIIVPDYVTALIRTLRSDKTKTATPDDFLTRDGYAQWMETVRDEFQFVIAELLRGRYLLGPQAVKGDITKPKRARIDAKLKFKVLRAKGLCAKEGKARDAFCCIEVGTIPFPDPNPYKKVKDKDKEMFLTEAVEGSNNPEWNEHMIVQARSITDKVLLSVWDKKKDYFLGMVSIPVYDLVQASQRDKGVVGRRYTLGPRPGRKDKYVGGDIFIEAMITDAEPEDIESPSSRNPTEFLTQQIYNCHVNLRVMYKTLLRACLVLDVNTMGNEVTETTTELLGEESKALLKVFGRMWNIGDAFMVIANLEMLFIMYKEFQLPTGSLLTAYEVLYDAMKYNRNWLSRHEKPMLVELLDDMHLYYKQQVSNYKDHFPKNTPRRALETTILMLRMIHKNTTFRESHPDLPESFREELRKIMMEASIARFQKHRQLSLPLSDDDSEAVIGGISQLADMLVDDIEVDVKHFTKPFEKEVDIAMLTADSFLKYFVIELENNSETFASDESVEYSKSMFELYKKVKNMEKQLNKMLPSIKADLNVERWFAPFVMKWLEHLSERTAIWVNNAIAADRFEPVTDGHLNQDGDPPLYSSSITDLFTAVYSELEFLVELGWSNAVQNASFFQRFAQTVNRAIEQYCDAMGTGEIKEKDGGGSSASGAGAIASLTARELLAPLMSQSKQIREVTVQSCVKLSNIEYADTKLEQMYSDMNVATLTKTQRNYRQSMAPAARRGQERYTSRMTSGISSVLSSSSTEDAVSGTFKIQLAFGENLKPSSARTGLASPYIAIKVPDGTVKSPDSAIVDQPVSALVKVSPIKKAGIVDPSQSIVLRGRDCELARSRYVADTVNPAWDEAFQVMLPPVTRLEIIAYSRNLMMSDEELGRASINLSATSALKAALLDHMTHDVWVELEPQGRVLLRLTLEAEEEDVEFWFRRSKERMGRTKNDFVRALCSRIAPVAKDIISKALKAHEAAPLPPNTNLSRLAQMTGMAATQYTDKTVSGASIDVKVPPHEAEQAISPLTDYLNKNLETLAVNLSTKMAQDVIMATWHEALNVIDSVMIPPLYGAIERDRRFLNKRQLSVAETCLRVLRDFFHADGEGLGLPIRVLETTRYIQVQTLIQVYMNDSARIKREYELSLLKGQEKMYLLRLMRVRVECDGWEKKTEDKIC